jgi:hypothetical protein
VVIDEKAIGEIESWATGSLNTLTGALAKSDLPRDLRDVFELIEGMLSTEIALCETVKEMRVRYREVIRDDKGLITGIVDRPAIPQEALPEQAKTGKAPIGYI